ncbi:MAG TPA: HD-GYP domain-containing protein [Vicinamibacterales bacterium]|nr:HD-GYP domain-containing protein [Vicinamibacterales bacterium]
MLSRRIQLAEDVLRRLAAALRALQFYSPLHPLVGRSVSAFAESLRLIFGQQQSVTLGVVAGEFVVNDVPLIRTSAVLSDLLGRLQRAGVERITIDRAVTNDEIASLLRGLAALETSGANGASDEPPLPSMPHIEVGRIQIERQVEAGPIDAATVRQVYDDATKLAADLWEMTQREGRPDPRQARHLVDSLAQAAAQNRSALLALTALKDYDNYTFTHMVNVSILTMAQARALGIEGALLREFGLAALMHDIGKVRTPKDILSKDSALTADEYAIVKRHVVDGAEILRATPDIPAIAPIVAFEHHLRLDGTGYPDVVRTGLNLATQLCGIADVYDAMRSNRRYQGAFPTERILEVLRRNDGRQFDQRLVRRFVQIVGVYPVGNLVKLDTGETAMVVRVNPADPHRPHVRILFDADGRRVSRPYEVSLWDITPGIGRPTSIIAPVDPATVDVEPLAAL